MDQRLSVMKYTKCHGHLVRGRYQLTRILRRRKGGNKGSYEAYRCGDCDRGCQLCWLNADLNYFFDFIEYLLYYPPMDVY
eukprot:12865644-Heterocapsa_arctica.AAC.1